MVATLMQLPSVLKIIKFRAKAKYSTLLQCISFTLSYKKRDRFLKRSLLLYNSENPLFGKYVGTLRGEYAFQLALGNLEFFAVNLIAVCA